MRAADHGALSQTLLALGGCAADNTVTEQPAMYVNMADGRRAARSAGRGLDDFAIPARTTALGAVVIDRN